MHAQVLNTAWEQSTIETRRRERRGGTKRCDTPPMGTTLHKNPFVVRADGVGGLPIGQFVGEQWSSPLRTVQAGVRVKGLTRAFLASTLSDQPMHDWQDVEYAQFSLLGKRLAFTVDLSDVPCASNAVVSLVAMPRRPPTPASSGYCNIEGFDMHGTLDPCIEIDLLEGNAKGVQATLHTVQGKESNGACNQLGCRGNWGGTAASAGNYGSTSHGLGARPLIDSSRPFTVEAAFPFRANGAGLNVRLTQASEDDSAGEVAGTLLDSEVAANVAEGARAAPIPDPDALRLQEALNGGLALVLSLRSAPNSSWLDGGCTLAYPSYDGMCSSWHPTLRSPLHTRDNVL